MKKSILIFFALSLSLTVWGIPAKKATKVIRQSDGSELSIQLVGDEHHHYWATSDGHPIAINEANIYEYALYNSDHQWVLSGVKAKSAQDRDAEENALLQQYARPLSPSASSKRSRVAPKRITRPVQATKNLVILMAYKDKAFTVSDANQAFNNLLNKKGYNTNGATGSVQDYFSVSSHSKYTPQFDVYGPYTASKNLSYYGQNDSQGYDMYAEELIVEACKLADAAGVDFSQYDADNDGYVDNVSVFYAGYSEAEWGAENTIWPHQYYLTAANKSLTLDGKIVDSYVCMNELKGDKGSNMCGIGTFCHEFSHALGLPDLYATDGSTHNTVGKWDVMDMGPYNNDGKTPPTYSAYERFFMGWSTPTVLNQASSLELEEIQQSNKSYMITSTGAHNLDGLNPSPATFYILENRQQTGWDTYLPGHGMIITRIAYSETKWYENTVNNTSRNMGVDIMEADGKSSTDGDIGDCFPSGATSYTPFSNYPITNIQEQNGVISFDFMSNDEGNDDNPDDNDQPGVSTGECFVETFVDITLNESADISTQLDNHCDQSGWEGEKVFAMDQGLKMGSSKSGGSLTTPALGLSGSVQVSVVASNYNNDVTTVELSVSGASTLSTPSLNCSAEVQKFTIQDCTPDTRVTFATTQGKQRFIIQSFEACRLSSTDLSAPQCDYSIHTQPGMINVTTATMGEVSMYNLMGQAMHHKRPLGGTCTLTAPQGIYILVIKNQDGTIIGNERVICP